MNAEILCVGTEILLGDIVNTNAAYIAKGLADCGIGCYYQTVVGDNPERLKKCLEIALARAEIVIMTGGLGPTYDDLTKETVAQYFKRDMELHKGSLDHLTKLFRRMDREMTDNNLKQAYMPAGATVFHNDRGTANGLMVQGDGKTAILMPGPPREMTAMFDKYVRPFLQGLSDGVLVSSVVNFYGIGESMLEQQLHDYMESHTNPTVAPYAKEGEVQLRVTARAKDEKAARALIEPVVAEIKGMFPDLVYGVDVGNLQTALVEKLMRQGRSIATAESCTAGLISKRITEVGGSSKVFGCGISAYSNEIKTRLLGVSKETLDAHGAVSAETALEMARGVRKVAGADIGLSVTGIAGPEGGTRDKPVGLVYIAVSTADFEESKELRLARGYGGERELIRYLASSN
ncbi:MAG: competence/damage-inducible protein A, partial [Oscillospiraceae bacterium]|nr:competence/damage-inducible protein A [Oscillospiraceae bacterium]